MKNKFKFLATMLIGILLSTNVWGETYTWTLPFSTTTNEWRTVNNAQFGACNSNGALNGGKWTNISNGSHLNLPNSGYFLVKVPITPSTTSFTLNASIFAWASSKYAVKTVTITYYTSKNTTEANICNGSTTTSGCYNVSEEITLPNSYVVTSNGTLFIKIAMQQGNDGFEALSVTTKSGSTKADVTLTPTQNARNLTVDDIVEDLSTWYTISPAAYDGTITYTSSNEDIFAEDEGAGYAFSTGTCNLYVNAPETSNYKAANCTISVTVTAPAVKHNVNWHVSGVVTTDEVAEGATITFPATPTVPDACSDKVFYGWAKSAIVGETDDAPTVYTSETMGTADIDFYAVFATASSGSGSGTVFHSQPGTITSGDYYLVDTYNGVDYQGNATGDFWALKGGLDAESGTKGGIPAVDVTNAVSVSGNVLTLNLANLTSESTPSVYTITFADDSVSFALKDGDIFYNAGNNVNADMVTARNYRWQSVTNEIDENDGRHMLFVSRGTGSRCLMYNDHTSGSSGATKGNQQHKFKMYQTTYSNTGGTKGPENSYGSGKLYFIPAVSVTYSNYVTSCAAYTVTFKSNGADVTSVSNVAPGQQVTAPTLAEIKTQAGVKNACTNYLVGWSADSHYTNPSAAPSDILKPNAEGKITIPSTVTSDVTYYAVYADVVGE